MSLSPSQLQQHAVWESVALARSKLEAGLPNADAQEAALIAQWQQAVVAVERLKEVDSWRFVNNGTELDQLKAQLDALAAELQPLIDDGQASVASSLAARLEAVANLMRTAPVMAVTSGHLSGITATIGRFNAAVEDAIDRMRARVEAAKEAVDELESKRVDEVAQLKESMEELRALIAQEKQDVTSQASRLDTAITGQTEKFNANQTSWREAVDALLAELEGQAKSQREKHDREASEALDSIVLLEAQSRSMVEVTARNTISTGYAQYARRQGWAATLWSVAAVALAVGGIWQLVRLVTDVATLTTAEAIFKTTVSTAVLGTAAFMGREAAGHRREARDAKRTQLDLNALEPFLANLEPQEALMLRKGFAYRVFGRPMANDRARVRLNWKEMAREWGQSEDEEKA